MPAADKAAEMVSPSRALMVWPSNWKVIDWPAGWMWGWVRRMGALWQTLRPPPTRHLHETGLLQHSAGWLRHRPDQRGGVMGLFRHGPARPGPLFLRRLGGVGPQGRGPTRAGGRRGPLLHT